jgi:two-component system sensor histidine kinase KdpD
MVSTERPQNGTDRRPDPDALIRAAQREGRGRLKVFLGAAPGVGKTWEMLAGARQLHTDGIDVVIGVVETHGRAETAAQIGDLPILPRRPIAYRGQVLEEFDLDAALARRPALLLVDELAHTNAPGSRHNKRWEDVEELLAAGIDIWATLNVQHLESLNDAVARITGVRVRETLPDSVLGTADELEVVDLPPAELRTRLATGRIYKPEVAGRAMAGFFREGNLRALREMALRQAAAHVDADVMDYMRRQAIQGPWPVGERVLALVGPDDIAGSVVRHAASLATALRAPLIALNVERPSGGGEARMAMELAVQMGAEIELASGTDLVREVLDVAARRNVTQIVMGRGRPPLLRRLYGRTLARAMLRHAGAYALHVVPAPTTPVPVGRRRRRQEPWYAWASATAIVAAVTLLGEGLVLYVSQESLGMVFLAAVVSCAVLFGLAVALYAAVIGFMCWNFFFIPPLYELTVSEPRDAVAIVLFLGVAAATGALASRVRQEADAARSRIEGLRRIGAFSRKLGEPTTEPELLLEIARQAASITGRAMVLVPLGEDLNIRAAEPPADTMDEAAWAAARWAFGKQEPAGRGTATLPSAAWRFLPMYTTRGRVGLLGVRPERDFDAPMLQALNALVDQGAVAVERVRLATEAALSAVQEETQKLRTTLLSSLSHDLRTPLAGIRGAADTLRTAWDRLDVATRADLLRSIEDDTERMTHFLSNILDMTRLETGEIVPRALPLSLHDLVPAALSRVPGAASAVQDLPPDLPLVVADPTLLEQVLVNVLDNCVKHGAGGPIMVSAIDVGDRIVLRIADRGPGIPPEDLPHVFDSFYRARRGDRTQPGTGLGLAIARGLMEAMGGEITAQSPRPDAGAAGPPGTLITLRIPKAAGA